MSPFRVHIWRVEKLDRFFKGLFNAAVVSTGAAS
jgi:hypothetical protein